MTFEQPYTEQEIRHLQEQRELEDIKPYPHQLTPFPTETTPKYKKQYHKRTIAWILAFCAKMNIVKHGNCHIAKITLRHWNYDLLSKFQQIVKVGDIGLEFMRKPPERSTRAWKVVKYHQIVFLLENVASFIRSRREKHIAQLMIEFCQSRIAKHKKGQTTESPYTQRELEIADKVRQLNEPITRLSYRYRFYKDHEF